MSNAQSLPSPLDDSEIQLRETKWESEFHYVTIEADMYIEQWWESHKKHSPLYLHYFSE